MIEDPDTNPVFPVKGSIAAKDVKSKLTTPSATVTVGNAEGMLYVVEVFVTGIPSETTSSESNLVEYFRFKS